jgi:GH15 family glucan-1,4-alpha-glucosidase
MALGIEGGRVRARHVLKQGEQIYCALSWATGLAAPPDIADANERLAATTAFWRSWLARARAVDHPYRPALERSALAIKGLTYMPTGATVAALTTSLPETPGGERNWDYRYTWMRDSTFTLQALHYLNLDWEADEFMQFTSEVECVDDGGLQIMYGIDGRRDLTETTRDDLSGYAGARPVRVGNGAWDQRQNDVYGAVLDSILLHTRRSERLPRGLWPLVQSQAACATAVWREPDQGIWEARGAPQHYVSSKLMGWVALDRASTLAEIRGDGELAKRWRTVSEEIEEDILANGVDSRGVLRQHYDTDALDASNLLAANFGFLPGTDERLRATVLAIADELTEDGFVLRYRTDETDDGLSGKEGTFLICSFWLVSALTVIGEEQRARDLMERLLRVASPLGLYAEEFDAETAHHLGNFPQAFSHLALIEAAARLIVSERLREL